MKAVSLSYEDFFSEFVYDELSPSKLSRISGNKVLNVTGKNKAGYYRVSFKGRRVYVHRIIWLLHFPDYDQTLDIDHIDLDKSNNNISNLRLVTRSANLKNRRQVNSEYKNVFWECGRNRFHVYYQENKRRKTKMFTEQDYGTKIDALHAALKFREQLIFEDIVVLVKGDK